MPGSIPIILTFLSSMTATESAPVFFAANVKLLGIGTRSKKQGIVEDWGIPSGFETFSFATPTAVTVTKTAWTSSEASQ